MHDIGNVVNRIDHAQSGAMLAFRILDKMGMPSEDVATVISAIGNHDEQTAAADRKSTRLNSSHSDRSRMPSSA